MWKAMLLIPISFALVLIVGRLLVYIFCECGSPDDKD